MISDSVDLVIYHADCPDGWCSAFIARKKFPTASLLPRMHGQPIPMALLEGKNVLVCDFSWRTKEDNDKVKSVCQSFHILDHHMTAQEVLKGCDYATFDMTRSGAGITWDTLFPTQARPWYVDYVEDRDLWNWRLPESKVINAYLMTLTHCVDAWKELDHMDTEEAFHLGEGALSQVEHYIEKVTAQALPAEIGGYRALLVNAPYTNISDVCHEMLNQRKDVAIAAGWFLRGDGKIQYSFRSRREDDVDVSKIAQSYGGGGHRNAAGAQASMESGLLIVKTWLML